MNRDSILLEIEAAIDRAYGSRDRPDYSFVNGTTIQRLYNSTVAELKSEFQVTDQTDPNEDVCVALVLTKQGKSWGLDLSLVGPYAALFHLGGSKDVVSVLTSLSTESASTSEVVLIDILQKARITLLTKEIMETPTRLKTNYADTDQVRVFQALFSDVELLPWQQLSCS